MGDNIWSDDRIREYVSNRLYSQQFITEAMNTDPRLDISLPGLSSVFTESLVIRCPGVFFNSFIHGGVLASRNGKNSDCIIRSVADGRYHKAEVKGTAGGFSEVKYKDRLAEYLVWIHFGEWFQNDGTNEIEIMVLRNPGKHLIDNGRRTPIGIKEFRVIIEQSRLVGDLDAFMVGSVDEILNEAEGNCCTAMVGMNSAPTPRRLRGH